MKKTDIIKFAAGIFALSAVMFSFAGCDRNESQQSSVSESSVSIQDDVVKQEEPEIKNTITPVPVGVGHSFENIKSIQYSGENIYVYEQMNGAVQKEVSVLINSSSAESRDVDLSAVDYLYIQYMAGNEKNICMTYCDNENNLKMCLMDIETGKIIADKPISQDYQIFALKSDDKGNFTAANSVYTDTGISYRYSVYSGEDLSEISETELSGKYIKSDTEIVTDVLLLQDGSVAFYTADYKPDFSIDEYYYKINAGGEEEFISKTIEEQKGHPVGMYLHENGNICVCTTDDYIEYYVYELDSKTGDKKAVHTVDAGNGSRFISTLSIPGYDFTYISSAGVVGYSFDSKEKDTVLEFGKDLDTVLRESFTASSCGDNVYMYVVANAESSRLVTSIDKDGKVDFSSELPTKLGYASAFGTAPDGTVIYSETYDPGRKTETSTGFNMEYIFHILDKDGSPKSTFTVDEINDLGDAVIQSIDISSSGEVYMLFQTFINGELGTRVYVTDKSGKIINTYVLNTPGSYITDVVLSENGGYAVCLDSDGSVCVAELKPENTDIKNCEKISVSGNAAVSGGNGAYDIYFRDSEKIYGYSVSEQKETEIFNLSEGIDETSVTDVYVINDSRILCSVYDSETGESGLVILEK